MVNLPPTFFSQHVETNKHVTLQTDYFCNEKIYIKKEKSKVKKKTAEIFEIYSTKGKSQKKNNNKEK